MLYYISKITYENLVQNTKYKVQKYKVLEL
jgi:hypothetical protein